MIDEKDLSVEKKWYFDKLAKKVVKALKKDGMDAEFVPNREDALTRVIELIPEKGTIGRGDSVTLHQIGIIEWLKDQKEHEVFDQFILDPSDFPDNASFLKEHFNRARKALTADVFLTGTNAITLNGQLVNIDGIGNRVAGMIFGPNRVIVVAGYNKIVKDVDEALYKIHQYIAPINNRRHREKHGFDFIENLPCQMNGVCTYCHTNNRSCRITTIISGWASQVFRAPNDYPPYVIIVGEHLGI